MTIYHDDVSICSAELVCVYPICSYSSSWKGPEVHSSPQIVKWLTPAANWMKNLPAGWVIPIAVMFIISFPPLFGHEIVAILCGVVWGLWVGFGIVAAGTMLGEVSTPRAAPWTTWQSDEGRS